MAIFCNEQQIVNFLAFVQMNGKEIHSLYRCSKEFKWGIICKNPISPG